MRKLIIKISVALAIIGVGIASIFLVNKYLIPNVQSPGNEESIPSDGSTIPSKNDSIVNVNIIITDIEGNTLHNDTINGKDKTLIELLEANYEIRYEKESIGSFLYDIEEIKTDKYTTFIGIYVNDKFSNYGIDYIKLYDGIKIEFRETKVW